MYDGIESESRLPVGRLFLARTKAKKILNETENNFLTKGRYPFFGIMDVI